MIGLRNLIDNLDKLIFGVVLYLDFPLLFKAKHRL